MKKLILILMVALAGISVAHAQLKWNLDASHSSVKFSVTHLVVSEVEGSFKMFSGNVTSKDETFENGSTEFTVDVASINTDDADRDKHLKSDDFFNAEKYPKMTFKSKSFKKVKGNKYALTGDLTIRDVTKPVNFDVTFGGVVKDPWGNTKSGFKATANLKPEAQL
jgi:polyisoprenoid-binding protein YceI